MNLEFGLLLGAGLAAALWWDGLQKRELAIQAARRACRGAGVQFLDETVALKKWALRRSPDQQLKVYREFGFEFSETGDDRREGRICLLGPTVVAVHETAGD